MLMGSRRRAGVVTVWLAAKQRLAKKVNPQPPLQRSVRFRRCWKVSRNDAGCLAKAGKDKQPIRGALAPLPRLNGIAPRPSPRSRSRSPPFLLAAAAAPQLPGMIL
ncbi:hypothetical protein AOLI_G00142260 [Acnodon oligacanthus]